MNYVKKTTKTWAGVTDLTAVAFKGLKRMKWKRVNWPSPLMTSKTFN